MQDLFEGDISRQGENEDLPTVQEMMQILTGLCDGAKKRDGAGFNKADSRSGARLATMAKVGIPWGLEDSQVAVGLLKRYAGQVSKAVYPRSPSKARRLERNLREGRLPVAGKINRKSPIFNYIHPSSGGNYAYVMLRKNPEPYKEFVRDLKEIGRHSHGSRRIRVRFSRDNYIVTNGRRERVSRWVVDWNSTSRNLLVPLARKWRIVVDTTLLQSIESDLDKLSRYPRYCYLFEGVRKKIKGEWCVFDLYEPDREFNEEVKSRLRGYYYCHRNDDFNWFIILSSATVPILHDLIRKYQFRVAKDLVNKLSQYK